MDDRVLYNGWMRWLILVAVMACSHPARAPRPPPHNEVPADAAVALTTSDPPAHVESVDWNECTTFDPKNPACRDACPPIGTADCKCPDPPDVNLIACQNVMPCPNPPDRRVRQCRNGQSPPDHVVLARILGVEASSGGIVIGIGIGRKQGIDESFHGGVLEGDSDTLLAHGELAIVRIDPRITIAKVALTKAELGTNTRVKLVKD